MRLKALRLIPVLFLLSCRAVPPTLENPMPQYTQKGDWSAWNLSVASINVWNLAVISKDNDPRMTGIGERIAKLGVDLALLQEAWTPDGRQRIQAGSKIPYMESFNRKKSIGSGLATLAHAPTLRRSFLEFALNGEISQFWEGDPFSEKGISLTTITWKGLPISVFNVHTIARHGDDHLVEDEMTPHRLGQVFEIFSMIVEQTDSDAWILAGDLNMRFFQTEYRLLNELLQPVSNLQEDRDPQFCTSCPENPYGGGTNNGQLDYVFVSPRLALTSNVRDFDSFFKASDGKSYMYSDHYGWVSSLAVRPGGGGKPQVIRQRIGAALAEIRLRLETEIQGKILPFGVEERFQIKENMKHLANRIRLYESALSGASTIDAEVQKIRVRLDSFIAIQI